MSDLLDEVRKAFYERKYKRPCNDFADCDRESCDYDEDDDDESEFY